MFNLGTGGSYNQVAAVAEKRTLRSQQANKERQDKQRQEELHQTSSASDVLEIVNAESDAVDENKLANARVCQQFCSEKIHVIL